MDRQQNYDTHKCKMDDTATFKAKWYEYTYDGQVCIEDKEARLGLSTYDHDNVWSKSSYIMKRY